MLRDGSRANNTVSRGSIERKHYIVHIALNYVNARTRNEREYDTKKDKRTLRSPGVRVQRSGDATGISTRLDDDTICTGEHDSFVRTVHNVRIQTPMPCDISSSSSAYVRPFGRSAGAAAGLRFIYVFYVFYVHGASRHQNVAL